MQRDRRTQVFFAYAVRRKGLALAQVAVLPRGCDLRLVAAFASSRPGRTAFAPHTAFPEPCFGLSCRICVAKSFGERHKWRGSVPMAALASLAQVSKTTVCRPPPCR